MAAPTTMRKTAVAMKGNKDKVVLRPRCFLGVLIQA